MPGSSEGFEHTGLPPNPAVSYEQLDPKKFDPQTHEIIMRRLNKVLLLDPKASLDDALTAIGNLQSELTRARAGLSNAWSYFHTRFQGLRCGMKGTWEEAINEVIGFVNKLHGELNQKTMELDNLKAEVPKASPAPALTLVRDEPQAVRDDRTATLSGIPELERRLCLLESDFWKLVNQLAPHSGWYERAEEYFNAQSKQTPEGPVSTGK